MLFNAKNDKKNRNSENVYAVIFIDAIFSLLSGMFFLWGKIVFDKYSDLKSYNDLGIEVIDK